MKQNTSEEEKSFSVKNAKKNTLKSPQKKGESAALFDPSINSAK